MRIGQNPAHELGLPAYSPQKLGVAVLVHIPSEGGYFTEAMEVLKYQIASIHHSTSDFDLLVFDNGSCVQVKEELARLQAEGRIRYLLLSQVNLGKVQALNWLLASLPNEFICFTDGDVLFRPGWQEKTFEIFDAFPIAGIVTAQPCMYDILRGEGRAHLALQGDSRYRSYADNMEPVIVFEYVRSLGLGQEKEKEFIAQKAEFIHDLQSGVQAVLGASHMQFVIRREHARQLPPLPSIYALQSHEDRQFDLAIDRLGLLHLSTLQPYVYHMGNHLDDATRAEIGALGLSTAGEGNVSQGREGLDLKISPRKRRAMRQLAALARWPFLRNLLLRIYLFLFQFFSQKG